MNISRYNYEEFFLLYADGELDAGGKKAVELFATLHPDLAEELDMLMDTILMDENLTMPGKQLLLKPELVNEEIISPLQEAMLMMLDHELGDDASKKLQKEIAGDHLLQTEWQILLQTKLDANAHEMPGKKALYHFEKDRRPIPILVVRWMAAAAVIAGLGWFGLSFFKNNKLANNGPLVANNSHKSVSNNRGTKSHPLTAPVITEKAENTVVSLPVKKGNETRHQASAAQVSDKQKPEYAKKNLQKQGQEQQVIQYATVNQPPVEMLHEPKIESNTIAGIDSKEITNPIIMTIYDPEEVNTVAQQAVYKEESINDNNEFVNIAGAHIKKQKLRGVFRNVTRTIGRTFDKSNIAQADVASLR